jgi:hypothetical protein
VRDTTNGALMLAAALALALCGVAWFALAMDVHWRQVRAGVPTRAMSRTLRAAGALALLASLLVCLRVDHATMAPLVWVMALAGGALLVALALAWRPRWLAPLVAWLRQERNATDSH